MVNDTPHTHTPQFHYSPATGFPAHLPPLPPIPSHNTPHQHHHPQPDSPAHPHNSYNPFARSAHGILARPPSSTPDPAAHSSHPPAADNMSTSGRPRRAAAKPLGSYAESTLNSQYAHGPLPSETYQPTGAYSTRRASRGASTGASAYGGGEEYNPYGAAPTRRSARGSAGGGVVSYDEDALADEAEAAAYGEVDASFEADEGGAWDGQHQQQQQQGMLPNPYGAAPGGQPIYPQDPSSFGAAAAAAAGNGPTKLRLRVKDDEEEDEEGEDAPGEADDYPAGGGEGGEGAAVPPANGADGGDYNLAAGDDEDDDEDEEAVGARTTRGRGNRRAIVDTDDDDDDDEYGSHPPPRVSTVTASGRQTRRPHHYGESDSEKPAAGGGGGGTSRLRRGAPRDREGGYGGNGDDYDPDEDAGGDDDDFDASDGAYGEGASRRRSTRASSTSRSTRRNDRSSKASRPKGRQTRNSRRSGGADGAGDPSYEHSGHSDVSTDEEMLDLANDSEDEEDDESGAYGGDRGGAPAAKRNLRNKPRVNYYMPPPPAPGDLNNAAKDPWGGYDRAPGARGAAGDKKGKGKASALQRRMNEDGNPFAGLPANMTGAQWAALYPEGGQPSDSSDDDDLAAGLSSPRKNALFSGPGAASLTAGGGGMLASGGAMDFGSGAPNNLGKVGGAAALADTDPLGVPQTISFSSVGGLSSHIQQLKEMVSLPLLYPEVFERFAITPPRGVLFHGPPGTGKTLLARALAASCSTEGRKISFFMRKGADCLSKWVGEAERQLRLLFEEARACQPSIIFFDEIDGLAPVRSSKQEQIHASIVSTLLALMDGMDGRGQVIVIGATNRPDAIDPALRRPGRFDREFYFPLPNREARRKILEIHTEGWNPPLEGGFMDELAELTKGYGGADLRALCTEAALNAVQRTYPQIYKTNDRLLIKPETIGVTARDFVLSQKNLIPSTARSTSSSAAPLPPQLVPLLQQGLDNAKTALAKVLPEVKKVSVLEEAEYVDEGGGFEKEQMLQAFETLRVFRPRLLICGDRGMGQSAVGAAVLHHLEGFHVQLLDLATLVSDSSRTMEAACVQLFVEAKRHKPSILFIPQLVAWCASVGETVRATISGLLDGLDPSDPILLLAVVEGSFKDLPSDVRSWFGFVKGNRVVLGKPGPDQRTSFFADVLAGLRRPPNEYPDAMPRRKRILEKLPIAPPPPPRAPTAAEIAQQEQNDLRLLEYLKWKLGPVLAELKKRYKRFTRSYYRDWQSDDLEWRQEQLKTGEAITGLGKQPYHNVDLDSMSSDLYKGFYCTPDDFVTDILRIQHNAEVNKIMENDAEAPIRAGQMVNHTKVMLDQTFDQHFRNECDKMAARMREKDENRPDGGRTAAKEKRKGKGGDVAKEDDVVQAAKEAAVAGGLNARHVRPNGEQAEEDADGEVEIVEGGGGVVEGAEGENPLKRAREDGDEEAMEGVEAGEQGPSKRPRQDGEDEQQQVAVNLAVGQAVASTSNGGVPPAINGVAPLNGDEQPLTAASTASFSDLLNPSSANTSLTNAFADPAAAAVAHFSEPPAQANPFIVAPPPGAAGLAQPMPVGAVPSASPQRAEPSAAAAAGSISFLTGAVPAAATTDAARNPFSPAPGSTNGDALQLPAGAATANGTTSAAASRDVTPTPTGVNGLFGDSPSKQQGGEANGVEGDKTRTRTPTPMESTPPPLPDFVLSEESVAALESFLVDRTGALSVDQLEQLRAACFDAVWRARGEWDRARVVGELRELVEEFVEEVEALEEA
ncbi:hypothetical protein JCM6882_006438 [Rhodosporidiobolus microsporus]